jgi:hypothetical protein
MYLKAALVGILAVTSITGVTAFWKSPRVASAPTFNDQWNNAVEFPLEQRVRIIDLSPKPVKTEIIVPTDPEVKASEIKIPEVKTAEGKKPKVKIAKVQELEPKRESNICTRHKMHKVYTRNGRSWRCRK